MNLDKINRTLIFNFGAVAPVGPDRDECTSLGGWAGREYPYGAPCGRTRFI